MTDDARDAIDACAYRKLHAGDAARQALVDAIDPRDGRGRRRGITTAKRLIRADGYLIRESDDRRGRYMQVRHTDETRERHARRIWERQGRDYDRIRAGMLEIAVRRYHEAQA